ncbi:thiamine-phosphate pyrophosphorylase [Chitinophaga skermanii]|uniref:Thiamine-phosphate pyrophosphorylase n=1 Tax=Chitinophaga skermanii TaxID=331697 RepID=A0A327QD26_9BACT|nr:thiamine phosphate synthase [Chitinophaga skermanii]RAJ01542.1 thiamine-phosphate pyrophosphorylase [Chitinophaga skermanii]
MVRAITHPVGVPNEISIIQSLLAHGLEHLLVRKPGFSAGAYEQFIGDIPREFYPRIMVAEYPAVAAALGLKGVHLNSQLRMQHHTLALQQTGMQISTSIHAYRELQIVAHFNEVYLSPVFDSISKSGYHGRFDHSFHPSNRQLIALGGINSRTINIAKKLGFSSVACIGALWDEPTKALSNYLQLKEQWAQIEYTP